MRIILLPALLVLLLVFSTSCTSKSIDTSGSGTVHPQEVTNTLTYEDVIDHVDNNITDIIGVDGPVKPANGKRFADGYGFVSSRAVYVDFEDGHFLYRALLECDKVTKTVSCRTLALFYNQEGRVILQGEDDLKDKPIVHTWPVEYNRQR